MIHWFSDKMEQSTGVVGLDAQGNMLFTMVKPVMGIFQVSSEQTVTQGGISLQSLPENTLILPPQHDQVPLETTQVEMHAIQPHLQPQMQVPAPVQTEEAIHSQGLPQNSNTTTEFSTQMPFAEVSSLLDPNMKGSKARKYPLTRNFRTNCKEPWVTHSQFQGNIWSPTTRSSAACRLRRRCPCARWLPTRESAEVQLARRRFWSPWVSLASRPARQPPFPHPSPNSLKVKRKQKGAQDRNTLVVVGWFWLVSLGLQQENSFCVPGIVSLD